MRMLTNMHMMIKMMTILMMKTTRDEDDGR